MTEPHIQLTQELIEAKHYVDTFMADKWPTQDFTAHELSAAIDACDHIKTHGCFTDYIVFNDTQTRLQRFADQHI